MKKIIILITSVLSYHFGFAQYSDFNIKEQYDARQINFIDNGSYNPCTISDGDISGVYGDGMSYVLESYIKMYETSNDKAYLIKFILNAICMVEHRQDYRGISTNPRWDFDPEMYHDGLIIWAMSHFVYLVLIENNGLENLSLPQLQDTKIVTNNFGVNLWNTYGDFANWLNTRTMETLDYFTYGDNTYWADDTRCYTPNSNPSNKTKAQSVNQQAGLEALFSTLEL